MVDYTNTRAAQRPAHVLSWLSWTHFLNDGIANYLPGVLPFIVTSAHIPLTFAGTLMTALGLGQGLQPLSGWIADRIGGRMLVLGGVALSTTSAALIGWAHPLWLLLCLLFFTGIGNTAFHPQALSMTRSALTKRPGVSMSLFLIGGEVGRSLGPLGAGFVVHRWGLPWIWLLAVPLILTYPWIVRAVPAQSPRPPAGTRIRFTSHGKPAIALLLYALVRSATVYEITTLAPIVWNQRGGSLVAGASLITVFIGIGIAGNLLGGTLDDRVGKRIVLIGTSALAVVTLMAFMSLSGLWEWPILALMGVALFGSSPTTMLIGQDIFLENPALGSGIALGLANALGAIMAFPLTYIAGIQGDATTLWILAILTILTIPTTFWMPLRGRRR